ncbi:hypothetical protein K469DRAFT_793465 [Zopfia rhizophila CBS 207.26]|uniref:Uncharacterized protein n=1 Tax=Zopfia rhizophila CBS 207.26 TaxID=1314779 RepID=A0A6A6DRN4_9PEZI|nr:hypothetical protein K469DRAFT_793465 [Zopfia rhizophila CBS 207.26]
MTWGPSPYNGGLLRSPLSCDCFLSVRINPEIHDITVMELIRRGADPSVLPPLHISQPLPSSRPAINPYQLLVILQATSPIPYITRFCLHGASIILTCAFMDSQPDFIPPPLRNPRAESPCLMRNHPIADLILFVHGIGAGAKDTGTESRYDRYASASLIHSMGTPFILLGWWGWINAHPRISRPVSIEKAEQVRDWLLAMLLTTEPYTVSRLQEIAHADPYSDLASIDTLNALARAEFELSRCRRSPFSLPMRRFFVFGTGNRMRCRMKRRALALGAQMDALRDTPKREDGHLVYFWESRSQGDLDMIYEAGIAAANWNDREDNVIWSDEEDYDWVVQDEEADD